MRRVLAFAGALAGLMMVAPPAAAQAPTGARLRVYFGDLEGTADSAYGAPAGSNFDAVIQAQDYAAQGLGAFTVRIYFDENTVAFVTARSSCPDSVSWPLQAPVTGTNYVELSAGGCSNASITYQNVVTVTFQVLPGATAGGSLYVTPRTLADRFGTNRSDDGDGDVDEVCLAVGQWGDVDDDHQVNSRDALIALSNAVGLPTPGYFISRGDVDGDGFVGSRDALAMLSASIGYPPASGFRTGRGINTACAPQAVLPRPVYYIRNGTMPGLPGVSGLVVRSANDSAETIVGDSAEANLYTWQRPRVAPNGSAVLFVCYWQYYYDICRANPDGSGVVNLTAGSFATNGSPDWSPASDSIVYLSNNQIWVMAADGSNQHAIAFQPAVAYGVAWDPVPGSRRIAYVDASASPYSLHTRDIDSTVNDVLLFTSPGNTYDLRNMDWSPAGDSLAFSIYVDGYRATYVLPSAVGAGGAARAALVGNENSYETYPAWTDQGLFITSYQNYPSSGASLRLFLQQPDGRVVRLRRGDTQFNYAAGMAKQ